MLKLAGLAVLLLTGCCEPAYSDTVITHDLLMKQEYKVIIIDVVKDTPEEFCITIDTDPKVYCYPQE